MVESTGDPLNRKRAGTISVDRSSYRVDYEHGGFDTSALFSADGGKTETALNSTLLTYFAPGRLLADALDSRLFSMPPLELVGPPTVTLKEVKLREEPSQHDIDGRKTRKYVLNFSYDITARVGTEKLRAVVRAIAELWTTEELEASYLPLDPRRVRTGFDAVDHSLRQAMTGVKGFPLERRLSVTRRISGGAPFTDLVTTTFSSFEPFAASPQLFEVPSGYRHQNPILGVGN